MKKKEAREILGVQESDDEAVIKKAYRKLALKNHPDKNKGSEESKQKFQQISEAYKCLTDPKYFDENMDGMEGFSMDEEELFAMFNMMFGFDNMFDGGRGGGIGGGGGGLFDLFEFLDGGDDGIGGLFGGGGMGGGMMGGMGGMFDLPNVEDLTPSEMKVAEEFVNNGDEEGLFIYLQELKSRINKREKMNYDDNNNNRNKSKNSRRNINGSTSSGSSSKNNDRKVSRANSSENKLKSSSSFLHYDDDDDFEDSDDERAQMEAFAAMLGMPPSLAKEMMNSDEMFSGSGSSSSSRNSKSKRTSRKMPSEMYDTQDMMGDEDLEQFAAMMGIPTALARQMMMEEMGDDGFNNRNSSTLRSSNNKKKKKKGKKKNSNASSANVYHRNTNRMNAEEMAFENFMMGFEGPNNNNNNNNRKSFEEEILNSLMSEMEFEKNNM